MARGQVRVDFIAGGIAKMQGDMSRMKNSVQSIQNTFKNLGSVIGITLGVAAVHQVKQFLTAAGDLAGVAHGVKRAFDTLPNSVKVMKDLKEATMGTVSELSLMKAAVKAENFHVPLEKLGSFFKFATIRAQETGESVDYLVESIINGIGRKSALILDNLGISAADLQEEMKKVGDFGAAAGNIIERELGKTSGAIVTAATESAQLSATWEDFRVAVGTFVNEATTGLVPLLVDIVNKMKDWTKELNNNKEASGFFIDFFNDMRMLWADMTGDEVTILTARIESLKKSIADAESSSQGTLFDRRALVQWKRELASATSELEKLTKVSSWGGRSGFVGGGKFDSSLLNKPKGGEKETHKIFNTKELENERGELNKLLEVLLQIHGALDLMGPIALKFQEDFKNANGAVKESFENMGDHIQKVTVQMTESQRKAFKEFNAELDAWNSTLKAMQASVVYFIQDVVTTLVEGVVNAFMGVNQNIGLELLNSLGRFLSQLGVLLVNYGVAMMAFEESLKSGNYYAVIIAGIALAAAGAAVQAFVGAKQKDNSAQGMGPGGRPLQGGYSMQSGAYGYQGNIVGGVDYGFGQAPGISWEGRDRGSAVTVNVNGFVGNEQQLGSEIGKVLKNNSGAIRAMNGG